MKVLLVEDYASLAIMLKELATIYAPSCRIEWVDRGEEAVKMIENGTTYDAIIMNYSIPAMDGVEATKAIRKLGYKGLIIGWSGFLKHQREEECLKAGMNFYVEKSGNLVPTIEMLKSLEKRALTAGSE